MSKKFIPDGDIAFAQMAENFAKKIAEDPNRFHIPENDGQALLAAVTEFLDAMKANQHRQLRSMATVMRKDQARAEAERLIRRAGHLIRVNREVSVIDKMRIAVKEKPSKLRKRECPQTPPRLTHVASKRGWQALGNQHLLKISDGFGPGSGAKPDGAVRLELFVDVIPVGQMPPDAPLQRLGGQPSYLRSYSRSPIEVAYPKFAEPVQVLYWGRWASATGETGPFSRTLAVTTEGIASQPALPAPASAGSGEQKVFVTTARRELPDYGETLVDAA